jgi:hypothetical protein
MMTTKILLEFVFIIYKKQTLLFFIASKIVCVTKQIKKIKMMMMSLRLLSLFYNKEKRNDNDLQQDYDDGYQEFIIAI